MKRLFVIPLMVVMLLAACGSATMTAAPAATAYDGQPAPAGATGAPASTEAPAATEAPTGEVPNSAPGSNGQLAYAPAGSRMVIKDANLSLLVHDTPTALDRVTQLTSDVGGYIISSQSWYDGGYMYAELRLGIPSAEFERALNTLRTLALQVVKEDASGQDVSAEYVDLQSKLTNLQATADRVRDFLKSAKTIDESLRINQQLSDLEGQIEQVKGQMSFYQGRAAFSTVTITLIPQFPTPTPSLTATPTLTPTATPTRTATPAWNPGQTFGQASTVLTTVTERTTDVTIWVVVVAGPILFVLGALALIIRRLSRGRIKK
jgi:Domain of unknown function (DUF4349)